MDNLTTEANANLSPWQKGLFAITLFVEDLEATKQFYLKTFGLPIVFEGDTSVVFKFGNTLINLLVSTQADELIAPAHMAPPDAGARFVFTVSVDDVDAMCAELTARSVKLLNGPMDRPWGIRTASFLDPGGYIWEIAK